MIRKRRAYEAALSAYWNAVSRGEPANERARLAKSIVPDHARAIERAHAAHVRNRPDAAFAARLEADLLSAYARPATVAARPAPANSRPIDVRRTVAPAEQIRIGSRLRWMSAQLG